jgi:hypothetical protein
MNEQDYGQNELDPLFILLNIDEDDPNEECKHNCGRLWFEGFQRVTPFELSLEGEEIKESP